MPPRPRRPRPSAATMATASTGADAARSGLATEPLPKRAKTASSTDNGSATDHASAFLEFAKESPSPFHCVYTAAQMLHQAGFTHIAETDVAAWRSLSPGGKYYFTRNESTIVAFALGAKWKPGNGYVIIGAHTDSPNLRLKSRSAKNQAGVLQCAVECYGGGLWYTWLDRDLSIAGRVMLRKASGGVESRLVNLRKPIVTIPSLAIHLNRTVGSEGLKLNKETNLGAIVATEASAALNMSKAQPNDPSSAVLSHPAPILDLVCAELGCEPSDLVDVELHLYDSNAPGFSGAYDEFVSSARLDNQLMSFVAVRALIDSVDTLGSEPLVRMATLFDNEEVGSKSNRGADSSLMDATFARIDRGTDAVGRVAAMQRSLVVSADMAHAEHPNYASKHDATHRPKMQHGLVIKTNTNERYSTTAMSRLPLVTVAQRHGLPLQYFMVRNDMPCGSTIGPFLSSLGGVMTVDVGIPQLAMHSIREFCGRSDIESSVALLTSLFREYSANQKLNETSDGGWGL